MALGAGLGTAFGAAIGNVGVGLAVGVALGLALASYWDAIDRGRETNQVRQSVILGGLLVLAALAVIGLIVYMVVF